MEQTLVASRALYLDHAALAVAAVQPQPPAAPPRVVSVHVGMGQVADAGYTDAEWIEGRLFVYEDGTFGFLWLDAVFALIDYVRLPSEAVALPRAASL